MNYVYISAFLLGPDQTRTTEDYSDREKKKHFTRETADLPFGLSHRRACRLCGLLLQCLGGKKGPPVWS